MKPGLLTTEFWGTLLVHAAGITLSVLGVVEAPWALGASALAQAVYNFGRSMVKAGGAE